VKLLKCTQTKCEDGENIYTSAVEMISDDLNMLKSKARDLCQQMGVEPTPWCGRYPIMGEARIESTHEWVMELSDEISFVIEK
jgi:hypothetical protein